MRRWLKAAGVAVGGIIGVLLFGGGALAFKVFSRPPLDAVLSTTHATLERQDCIECHTPIAGVMPAARSDDVELGVDCTSCHVSTRGINGAGQRPTAAHQTLADARFQDPALTSAALCHTCHRSTVEAWEATSLAKEGVTCLDCHMPRVRAASVAGGPERDRGSHRFPADKDDGILEEAVNAALEVLEEREGMRVARVRITNDRVGHHLPSGGNWLSVRLMASDSSGQLHKEQLEVFGRNETLVLDFWPFNRDTRIPFGERREIRFILPEGRGTVEAVIRYHDWMRTSRVVRTLREDY